MRKDWAEILDAARLLDSTAAKSTDSRDKEWAENLVYGAGGGTLREVLEYAERLEMLCQSSWQAHFAKSVLDQHSDAALKELQRPSGKAHEILERLWLDWAMLVPYPPLGDDSHPF